MDKTIVTIPGDMPGLSYSLTVLRFAGSDPQAPKAYLQAALHGNELPGVAALHVLIPKLKAAEAEGRLKGSVTVVPFANPIGLNQFQWDDHQGRFFYGSRTNFNRAFALIDRPDPALLSVPDDVSCDRRLKATLQTLALDADLVLDLHCDNEGPNYLYMPAELWPHSADLAAALDCGAVLTFEGGTDASFDEAAFRPHLSSGNFERRVVATVELKGVHDVGPETARKDGDGLYRFLVGRGVIADAAAAPVGPFTGKGVPQSYVEMVRAPVGGMAFFHVKPGDVVKPGQLVAEMIPVPGDPPVPVHAVAPGLVLTRVLARAVRGSDDLLKIVGDTRSVTAKDGGALES
ncbi:N-alpha-acetyl-L-2,4-diaminobutyric acid deacetylase [Pleomorphomonas sp. T1.2MG-36]|uniref:succinylglutamate desuccinylase/aspartoacylase domain-containing protein n=1 Tax=Pleomorphomonas sp. T1.2MG-36 TaxID=3041167 RepID=UPI002477A31F|nr:succinylglutamate desuccinylase/aspartoacylase family protein [Pleomorphomonas sp. T1.2MG-36]CAI9418311.1 N-alpha-acetyl-L-2,4-diaminobutyric acid deacetylase [Pleomorphomonas sp. T1.2MG-36]